MPDIKAIQSELRAGKIDGWLFYDHHHRDPIAGRVLGLGSNGLSTRRWFYFIPAKGEPRKLVHRIEQGALDSLAGKKLVYAGWEELHNLLSKLLAGSKKIAMQYSPENNIPYIGLVDAGTIELIRKLKKKVVTSADLVQKFEASWTPEQLESHLAAGKIVDRVTREAFQRAASFVRDGKPISEFELQQWMVEQFRASGLEPDPPIVAVQPNNGNPHYEPTADSARPIRAGDLLLLDVFTKFNRPSSVFYDITWMGYLGERVPDSYAKIFRIVRQARDRAAEFVIESVAKGRLIHGWEVDRVARETIRKAGYGKYFVHRTGHSIGQEVHGNGANMDGLETRDDRKIVPRTCFSIEPGIYLPEFGVRSEVNVYVGEKEARVTGAVQEEILPLLALS
ncbi:MAG TPA: Xaa-Pro peptidase family protein [Candidatus Acidoferrales bacterium]|nr:Xaa-Pro peptidase family protein [Candidatus Acidoferrales bacterium]